MSSQFGRLRAPLMRLRIRRPRMPWLPTKLQIYVCIYIAIYPYPYMYICTYLLFITYLYTHIYYLYMIYMYVYVPLLFSVIYVDMYMSVSLYYV